MPTPNNKDICAADLYAKGCEFCGARIPAQDYFGLERAHIISGDYAPEHRWNILLLCGNCHHIFDEVVKPRIFSAFRIAATGFYENPLNVGDAPFIAASNWKQMIERLDANVATKSPLPEIDATKTPWIERTPLGVADSP